MADDGFWEKNKKRDEGGGLKQKRDVQNSSYGKGCFPDIIVVQGELVRYIFTSPKGTRVGFMWQEQQASAVVVCVSAAVEKTHTLAEDEADAACRSHIDVLKWRALHHKLDIDYMDHKM